MRYFTAAGLAQLGAYRYAKVRTRERSIGARLLRWWWKFAAQLVPPQLAPNALTLTGLACMMVCYVLVSVYMPLLREEVDRPVPRWVWFVCGVLIFAYSTFDAIDGMHARRTGTASALGELCDHASDSGSMVLLALTFVSCIQLGPGWLSYAVCFCIFVSFFSAEWELKNSGRERFGHVNSTEGRVLSSLFFFVTGVYGSSIWLEPVAVWPTTTWLGGAIVGAAAGDVPPIRMQHVLAGVAIVWCVFVSAVRVGLCLRAADSLAKPVSHLVPLAAALVFSVLWGACSPASILATHPRLFIGLIGAHTSRLMSSMLVARLSGQSFPVYHTMLLPLPFAFFNSYAAAVSMRPPLCNEIGMLYVQVVLTIFVYVRFVYHIMREMREHLPVALFVIPSTTGGLRSEHCE